MKKLTVCLYHKHCSDGMAAAWVVGKYIDLSKIIFTPVSYGEDINDLLELVEDKDVYIVDFSFKREEMIKIAERASYVTCIDHHKSMEMELEELSDELLNFDFIFDNNMCGAMLTWKVLFNSPPPYMLEYIQDRDLWINKMENYREIAIRIAQVEKNFLEYDKLMSIKKDSEEYRQFVKEGSLLIKMLDVDNKNIKKSTMTICSMDGYKNVAVLNTHTTHSSDLLSLVYKEHEVDFAICYYKHKDGRYHCSLRSKQGEGVDVSIIAKKYGGGGHKHSGGMSVDKIPWKVNES